jgi:carboxyl-terminal processing protease
MKMQRYVLMSGAAALVLLVLLSRSILPGPSPAVQSVKDFDLMRTVADLIKNDYVEERDAEQTMSGAYRGLVNGLDPLSAYLDPPTMAVYEADRADRLKETGIVLFKRYNLFPQVTAVLEGSPAEKAGLKPGDTLSAFDDRSTLAMSLLEARLALKSAEAKPVKVRIIKDAATQDIIVERKSPAESPVRWSEASGGPLVLTVATTDGAAAALRGALSQRLRAAKGPLVLDLRPCAEGALSEAVKLVNVFLKADNAGAVEKRDGAQESLGCPEDPLAASVPLFVWTGPATLGAAEAAAGLLQESKRARVIGVETMGLASRQELFRLADGSGIVLTSGRYLLPSGRKLWDKGVVPDAALDSGKRDTAAYLKKTQTLAAGQ